MTICLRIDYVIKSVWCIARLVSGKWIHEVEGLKETGKREKGRLS